MYKTLHTDPDTHEITLLADHACPSCLSKNMYLFHELNDVPVNSVLNIATREKAIEFPKGNIALGFCQKCGFISNTEFNPELIEYSSSCEESQSYSPTYHKL